MSPIDKIGSWILIIGGYTLMAFQSKLGLELPGEIIAAPTLVLGRMLGMWQKKA